MKSGSRTKALARSGILIVLAAAGLMAADFKVGVARIEITPRAPIPMAGEAGNVRQPDGVSLDLWAKALALEDEKGNRAVIVTTDLIGLPRSISDVVSARVLKEYGLDRSALLLNSSNTHSGPFLRADLAGLLELGPGNNQRVLEYSSRLADDLVSLIGASLGDMSPTRLYLGNGKVSFARSTHARDLPDPLAGQRVPVLKFTSLEGELRAVVFGYACRNNSLPKNFPQISSDYAGHAQVELEKVHPGASAMFLMLTGADQEPESRGSSGLAQKYGSQLAAEVDRVLSGDLQPVRPGIRTAFRMVDLSFAPHTREQYEARLDDSDPLRAKHARWVLRAYEERRPVSRLSCPAQALRLGDDLTIVALGGETVSDYGSLIAQEFGDERTIVSGFSNEVMCYLPSQRLARSDATGVEDGQIRHGLPAAFTEAAESTILGAVRELLGRVGVKGRR